MMRLTLQEIAAACEGELVGGREWRDQEITSVTTDSRQIEAGCLFIALKGERVDGHDFISSVYARGGLCCITERPLPDNTYPYIQVTSSPKAIQKLAGYYRRKLGTRVVGVTGSVGKTSTKEMIASVLSEDYLTLKTQGNFNNELGLPLTIFRLRPEHEAAVLEMGISDFGEMSRLSQIAQPDVCVITNIGDCHLENLQNREGVLRAKTEIFQYRSKRLGDQIILNGDDEYLSTIREVDTVPPVFFGMGEQCPVYADQIVNRGLMGIDCVIHMDGEEIPVHIAIPGTHMVYNALAGAAVGRVFSMSAAAIKRGIEKLQPVGGRNHVIMADNYTIIDDCYNANPVSMKASLDVLAGAAGRTVAVLGDMFELGSNEVPLHEEVGAYAAAKGIDLLICIGTLSRSMCEAARDKGMGTAAVYYPNKELFMAEVPQVLQKHDVVLVKASHGMHFDQIVESLSRK